VSRCRRLALVSATGETASRGNVENHRANSIGVQFFGCPATRTGRPNVRALIYIDHSTTVNNQSVMRATTIVPDDNDLCDDDEPNIISQSVCIVVERIRGHGAVIPNILRLYGPLRIPLVSVGTHRRPSDFDISISGCGFTKLKSMV